MRRQPDFRDMPSAVAAFVNEPARTMATSASMPSIASRLSDTTRPLTPIAMLFVCAHVSLLLSFRDSQTHPMGAERHDDMDAPCGMDESSSGVRAQVANASCILRTCRISIFFGVNGIAANIIRCANGTPAMTSMSPRSMAS